VLFHKAARVEGIDLLAGTEINARTGQTYEEGWESEYVVTERVLPAQAPAEPTSSDEWWRDFGSMTSPWTPLDPDHREPALRIDLESIRVHQVRRSNSKRRNAWSDGNGGKGSGANDV
jgi:hypothetical protein